MATIHKLQKLVESKSVLSCIVGIRIPNFSANNPQPKPQCLKDKIVAFYTPFIYIKNYGSRTPTFMFEQQPTLSQQSHLLVAHCFPICHGKMLIKTLRSGPSKYIGVVKAPLEDMQRCKEKKTWNMAHPGAWIGALKMIDSTHHQFTSHSR